MNYEFAQKIEYLLQDNQLKKEGAVLLAEALKINQSLKELNLAVSHTRKKIKRIKQTQTTQNRTMRLGLWEQWRLQKHCKLIYSWQY